MTKTKINHFIPDFIVEKWEPLNKDGYHSGEVYYYDEEKEDIVVGHSNRVVARKNAYTQDTEDFFSQQIEGPFNEFFRTLQLDNLKKLKSMVLLAFTMGARNPLRPDFDKKFLDNSIKSVDWDIAASFLYEKFSFFLIKSKRALFLNKSGIVYLPPISSTGCFIYEEDFPIGLPINLSVMLCFCKKQDTKTIEDYCKCHRDELHIYSVGESGDVILPIDISQLENGELSQEQKEATIKQIKLFREIIIAHKSFAEKINEKMREMGLEAENMLRNKPMFHK